MWKAIRYRRLQAAVIALLATVVTACAVLTPLYDRAMQQALTSRTVQQASVSDTGIAITSLSRFDSGTFVPQDSPFTPTSLSDLAALLPARSRASFEPPVRSSSVTVSLPATARVPGSTGELTWSAGACDHLQITAGHCPTKRGQVLVSDADARNFALPVGTRFVATEVVESKVTVDIPSVPLTVVGHYTSATGPYWFDRPVTGLSGTASNASAIYHDRWLTNRSLFDGSSAPSWVDSSNVVDYPLDRSRAGLERVLALDHVVTAMSSAQLDDSGNGPVADVSSGLGDVAGAIREGLAQGRVTVPLLMVQLGLLSAVVLWLVLGAATEQRRPEVALARLRGRDPRRAGRLVVGELLPVTLAGVPAGVLVAFGLGWLVRHVQLPGRAPFEVRPTFALAALVAAVLLTVLTYAAARRVSRQPVAELLRRVPARSSGWALGVGDAVVIAAAGTAVVAFLTGNLDGPLAVAAPTLLAVIVGLALSHLVVPVATVLGHRLLARGRYSGVSLLSTARRPATRRVVAIVTVAASLLVFSGQAVVLGVRNRAAAAEQTAGAPMTATVERGDLAAVRATLADLHDRHVTPVLTAQPPGSDARATMAVVPRDFRRIAYVAGPAFARVPWDRLDAPRATPVRIRTSDLAVRVRARTSVAGDQGLALAVVLLQASGKVAQVSLGAVPVDGESTLRASVPCSAGCVVTGLGVTAGPTTEASGTLALSAVSGAAGAGRGAATFPGSAGGWESYDRRGTGRIAATDRAGALALRFRLDAADALLLASTWAPRATPTLLTGRGPQRLPRSATGTGLDGEDVALRPVGLLPRVPGSPGATDLVNLDVLTRSGSRIYGGPVVALWFDTQSPRELRRVRAALAAHGGRLGPAVLERDVRRGYDESIPAWSLALGVLVGLVGLLIAVLVLVVVAATTWRSRARDLAALQMSGVPARATARIAAADQLPAIVLAVVAGTACGVASARVALTRVPLFARPPLVSTLDLSVPWAVVLAAAAAALVLLLLTGWLTGRAIARRATLARVRETL